MKPGIYFDWPDSQYRSAPGVSQSSLKAIARSPAHFKAGIEGEKEDTASMILGRVAGTLVLEPSIKPWWTIQPKGVALSTTEGKEWAKEQCKWDEAKDGKWPRSAKEALEKKGVTIISGDEFENACRMATVLAESKKPEVRSILDGSKREVSVFADTDTPSGNVLCKCRPDIVPPESDCLADLKTTLCAHPDDFYRSIWNYGYHWQAYSYLKNWNAVAAANDQRKYFLFLCIEKKEPFAHCVHRLDADFLARGAQEYENALNLYAFCERVGEWPDYPPGINTISLRKKDQYRIE